MEDFEKMEDDRDRGMRIEKAQMDEANAAFEAERKRRVAGEKSEYDEALSAPIYETGNYHYKRDGDSLRLTKDTGEYSEERDGVFIEGEWSDTLDNHWTRTAKEGKDFDGNQLSERDQKIAEANAKFHATLGTYSHEKVKARADLMAQTAETAAKKQKEQQEQLDEMMRAVMLGNMDTFGMRLLSQGMPPNSTRIITELSARIDILTALLAATQDILINKGITSLSELQEKKAVYLQCKIDELKEDAAQTASAMSSVWTPDRN